MVNLCELTCAVFCKHVSEATFAQYTHIFLYAGFVESHPLSIKHQLQLTSTGVCVNCTLQDTSVAGCMALVHQRISQLSSSGLKNIESSHKFNRSGDTAYGCIEGINLSDYQIGVVGITRQPIKKENHSESVYMYTMWL